MFEHVAGGISCEYCFRLNTVIKQTIASVMPSKYMLYSLERNIKSTKLKPQFESLYIRLNNWEAMLQNVYLLSKPTSADDISALE